MSRGPRPRWRRPVRTGQGPLRMVGGVVLALFLFVTVAGGWVIWTYRGPGPTARAGPATTVILPKGASVGQIAHALARAGVIGSAEVFQAAARFAAAGRTLKAGEYRFASHTPMAQVLADIEQGKVVKHFVAVPEGWTSAQATDAVMRSDVLTGAVEPPPEGSILPDSYQVQRGEDRAEVIQRMRDAQARLLAELWSRRATDLPLATPQEAVTLASIVEKETGLPAERPRIAAVFENRLRAHMRLESDPTVIYGVSGGKPLGRGLTMSELVTATPYNTYRIDGLPPTPIGNPGRAALAAVLNPASSNELFFVADGSGGHAFSATIEAHARNVARWRAIEHARAAGTGTGK